jgi:phage N-6-adenine-methyltransferase
MSKITDERETPQDFFGPLHSEFHFDLDAAATYENAKVTRWLGPDSSLVKDALGESVWWGDYGRCVWLNPPYSNIMPWLRYAEQNVRRYDNFCCVVLLPASTSSKWWHRFIWDRKMHRVRPWVYQIRFPDKRLVFGPHNTGAKWPSVIVIFGYPNAG